MAVGICDIKQRGLPDEIIENATGLSLENQDMVLALAKAMLDARGCASGEGVDPYAVKIKIDGKGLGKKAPAK